MFRTVLRPAAKKDLGCKFFQAFNQKRIGLFIICSEPFHSAVPDTSAPIKRIFGAN